MGTKKRVDTNLSFRNFSPFYEKALAVAKREENILRIIEKDIDRNKMIAYSHLRAEQRLVEKDLYELRMARRCAKTENARLGRRALSDTNLLRCHKTGLQGGFLTQDELQKIARKKDSCELPSLIKQNAIVGKSPLLEHRARLEVSHKFKKMPRRDKLSLPSRDFDHSEKFVKRTLESSKLSGNSKVEHSILSSCSLSFTKANNAFDGQY